MSKLVIRNVGLMLSGRMEAPILEADCLIAVDGKIESWGREADLDTEGATTVIDAHGCTLAPGLIDSPAVAAAVPPEAVKQMVPAKRLGRPEDVADTVNATLRRTGWFKRWIVA